MISINNLTVGYDRHPALHHINANIEQGQMIAIIGPNGGGKSTLLKTIIGELEPMQGDIISTFKQVGYISQLYNVNHLFPISLRFFVSTALIKKIGLLKPVNKKLIAEALKLVKLEGLEKKYISTLSGGQFQRAQFARLYLQNADLLLLDEPFSAVDPKTTSELLSLLKEWNKQGKTIIAVMHNLDIVKEHFPYTIAIAREIIAKGNTEDVLNADNLNKIFSANLTTNPNAEICYR